MSILPAQASPRSALHTTTITLSMHYQHLFMHYQQCWCTVYALSALFNALFTHHHHSFSTVYPLSALSTHYQHCLCTVSTVHALSALFTQLFCVQYTARFASPDGTLWPNRHPSLRAMNLMSMKGLTLLWQTGMARMLFWSAYFALLVLLIVQGPILQGQTTTKITQSPYKHVHHSTNGEHRNQSVSSCGATLAWHGLSLSVQHDIS